MKSLTWLCAAAVVLIGCARTDAETGGDLGPGSADGSARADMRMAAKASWDIQANFTINGKDVQSSARSAVFLHTTTPAAHTEVILTDVVDYCAALKAKQCPQDASFRIVFGISGDTPGSYSIEQGQASVFGGDVTKECNGAGIGAASGTLTVEQVGAQPGGLLALRFDYSGLSGNASGKINAIFCDPN